MPFWRRKHEPESPDPLAVALDATLVELRAIASDLRETTDKVRLRVEKSKGTERRA